MAKSKSHSKPHSPKSKVVHNGPQQGLPPKAKAVAGSSSPQVISPKPNNVAPPTKVPAFSAANDSLQKAVTPKVQEVVQSKASISSEQPVELAPKITPPPKAVQSTTDPKSLGQPVLPPQVVYEAHQAQGRRAQRKWNGRPSAWIGASVGTLLLVVGGAAAGAYSKFASGGTIAPGVSIAGVPVGGLTPNVAKQKVLTHFGHPNISLLCDGKTVQIPISQLGAKLSVEPTVKKAFNVGRDGFLPNNLLRVYGNGGNSKNFMLPIEWNKKQLVKGLHQANSKIAVRPTDARLQAASFGLEVIPDRKGRELNVGSAAHLLQRKFYVGMPSLHIPSRVVEAKIKASALDGRDMQLAHYSTHFNSGLAGRTENLRIACRAIQNHVLMPGETFSFNACTGERTADKGYRMAHIFQRQPGATESEVVDGLAGGVCQVSSTLFNAVRKTNAKAEINPLKIVERTSHSLPVTYVPRGLDATVAWPYKDFKFKNMTSYPVYVQTQMGRSNLNISIWGRIPNA